MFFFSIFLSSSALAEPILDAKEKVLEVLGGERSSDRHVVERAAIDGMLDSIENRTGLSGSRVLTAAERAEERSWQAGIRDGYGLRVQLIQGRGFYIEEVIVDSPAETAGLQSGDIIISIAGQSLSARPAAEMVSLLKQNFEEAVGIEVVRQNTVRRFAIEKGVFQITMLTKRAPSEDQIIGLEFFGSGTAQLLREHLSRVADQPLVIDLRDNEGGLWDESIACLELFLPPELVLGYRRSINGLALPIVSHQPHIHAQPLIVLINGGTSGPAELFAITLQHHSRAKILGEPSTGFSVDYRYELVSESLILKLADAELLSPDQSSWSGQGVQPDLHLRSKGLQPMTPLNSSVFSSSSTKMQDVQLNKALQLISSP